MTLLQVMTIKAVNSKSFNAVSLADKMKPGVGRPFTNGNKAF